VTAAILLIKTVDEHLRAANIEGLRTSMPQEAPYYTTKTFPFYPPRRTQLIAPRSLPADVPGSCVSWCNGQNRGKKVIKGRTRTRFIPRGWNFFFLELELQISTPRSLKKPVQFPR
jgi:hypothetical protein